MMQGKTWTLAILLAFLPSATLRAWIGGAGTEEAISCRPEPSNMTIRYGDLISCRIESPTDSDTFRFSASAGDVVTLNFNNLQPPPATAVFTLRDQASEVLAAKQGFGAHVFRLETTGFYSIIVENAFRDPGPIDYVLALERIVPIHPSNSSSIPFLCDGCTCPGRIDPAGDLDVLFFEASAGDVLSLDVKSTSPLKIDPLSIEVINPDGDRIDSPGGFKEFSVSRSGMYVVQVFINVNDIGPESAVADYELTLGCLGGPCVLRPFQCGLPGEPTADLSVSGSQFKQGDIFVFSFRVENSGSARAGEVTTRSRLPVGTLFAGATASQGTCGESEGIVSCSLGDVDPGRLVQVDINLRVPSSRSGLLAGSLTAESPDCDPNPANDRAFIQRDLNEFGEFGGELVFPQIVDGVFGNTRFQSSLFLVNLGTDAAEAMIEFFRRPDGEALEVELQGFGKASSFLFDVAPGQTLFRTTSGADGQRVGYAQVRGGVGVQGVLVFSQTDLASGVRLLETGVPATEPLTRFSLFLDSMGDRDTGVAFVYPPQGVADSAAHVTVRLYDELFNLIAEQALPPLSPGSHVAQFVHQFFEMNPETREAAQEMRGLFIVTSDQPLMAVTLRQTDAPNKDFPEEVPSLTTFPVIPCIPGKNGCGGQQ